MKRKVRLADSSTCFGVGTVAGLTSGFLQVTKNRTKKTMPTLVSNAFSQVRLAQSSPNPYHQILSAVCFTKAPMLSRSFQFDQHHVQATSPFPIPPARCHGSAGSCPPPSPGRFAVAQRLDVQVDAFALRAGRGEWRHGQANRGPFGG